MTSVLSKLFIVTLVIFLTSCDDGYIEYPKINRELTLSKNSVNAAKDSEVIVEIVSGVGSFSVISKDDSIAEVELIGKKIHIDAVGEGETDILVKDNQTNLEKKIIVSIDKINFEELVLVTVSDKPYKFGTVDVILKKSFQVGKYEVTVDQFCNFINKTDKYRLNKNIINKLKPFKFPNIYSEIVNDTIVYIPDTGKKNFPVVSVDWDTAKEYCKSKGGRLPSEAEWEFAAQGGILGPGNGHVKMSHDYIDSIAWWSNNITIFGELHDVQTKKANILGIHNMIGNVAEWCEDNLANYDDYHLVRGGSTGNFYVKNTIHLTRFYSKSALPAIGFRFFKTVDD